MSGHNLIFPLNNIVTVQQKLPETYPIPSMPIGSLSGPHFSVPYPTIVEYKEDGI